MKKAKEQKHNYIYDVINFWLGNEKYEYYILALIDELPDIFQLKEESILKIVLEKFSDSCKDELINQKSEIVSKDYYARIFNKLYNHKKYDHQIDSQLDEIKNQLNNFVANGNFKLERKQQIYDSINNLGKPIEEIQPLYEIEISELKEQMKYISDYLEVSINDSSRMNFIKEETIIIGNENSINQYAYSINYTKDGSVLLRFHILDIKSIVPEDTPMYFDMKNNNILDKDVIDKISLNTDRISPVITYQLNITNRGEIYNFKYFHSLIKPQKLVNKNTPYNELKKDFSTKQFVYAYKILHNYYNLETNAQTFNEIDKSLVDFLTKTISLKIKQKQIPFVYKVQDNPNVDDYIEQLTNLNWYMFRLKDSDFRLVYKVICNKNNTKAHYSLTNKGHYGTKRKSFINITKPLSFIGLISQKMLDEIFIKNISVEEINEIYEKEFIELVDYYNEKFYGVSTPTKEDKKSNNRRVNKKD